MAIEFDKRIIRELGPALSERFGLQRGDVRIDGNKLVFSAVVDKDAVATLISELESRLPPKRIVTDSFAWIQGKQAKAWKKALGH